MEKNSFNTVRYIAAIGLVIVEGVIISILRSIYSTRYVLVDNELTIKTTKLIPLDTIESVEKTSIPFGIKLYGASFHGGHYKIPGLGRAFLAITNFDDGLLIRTTKRNYTFTLSTPSDFKHALD